MSKATEAQIEQLTQLHKKMVSSKDLDDKRGYKTHIQQILKDIDYKSNFYSGIVGVSLETAEAIISNAIEYYSSNKE